MEIKRSQNKDIVIPTDSSFIKSIKYSGKNRELSVLIAGKPADRIYVYQKVSAKVFTEFANADSFGKFYNDRIKDRYEVRSVS
jgi:hypothetical protein